jgi:hypothetical protein
MTAMHTQQILIATERENEMMRVISEKTQIYSRSSQILSCVAIAYMPASLVAVRLQLLTVLIRLADLILGNI